MRKYERLRHSKKYWFGMAEIQKDYLKMKEDEKEEFTDTRFMRLWIHRPYLFAFDKFAKWRRSKAYKLAIKDFLNQIENKPVSHFFFRRLI